MNQVLRNKFWLILLFLPLVSNGQTLNEYLTIAGENNLGLKASYAAFESALQRIPQAKALPDPSLSFGYFISPVETRVGPQRAKISLSQMFPWFGTTAAREDAASFAAEVKFKEFLDSKNLLYRDVKQTWYSLYEVHRLLALEKKNKELLQTLKDIALKKLENGSGSLSDVIRAELLIENSETDIEILLEEKRPLSVQFNHLLNRDPSFHISIPDLIEIAKLEKAFQKDSLLSNNPLLQAQELSIKSKEASKIAVRKMLWPKIGLGLDYAIVGKRQDIVLDDNGKDILMPMLTVSLPIFRKKYKSAIAEVDLQIESLAYSKADLENRLLTNHERALFQMEKAIKLKYNSRNQILKTEQLNRLLLREYKNSEEDFTEVLKNQQLSLKYQKEELKAVKDYYLALVELEYLTAKTE